MFLCLGVALELADKEQRALRRVAGGQLEAVAGDGDVEMVEGQICGFSICFRSRNGNIAIVGIDIFHLHRRRLVGRGYCARHRADDLAARGGNIVRARRTVHAGKGFAFRHR